MTEPAKRLATYADLLSQPAEQRAEIIHGELVVQPSPTPVHQSTIGEIYAELRNPFQRGRGGPGGWWLIQDVDVQFGPHDVCRPDISGWRRDRVPAFPMGRPVVEQVAGDSGSAALPPFDAVAIDLSSIFPPIE